MRYTQGRQGRIFVIRLEHGETVHEEIEKFAPHLRTVIHHGTKRIKDADEFEDLCFEQDIVITSYSLARKDIKLLEMFDWQRIVLDEAQNIKNPKSAQTKAIFKLNASSRLALTGTPVENRLMDLWSIFNFLNPGYLGTQTQFRKAYELPIQQGNNAIQSALLKKLIEPFILRRMKTDKNIIKDDCRIIDIDTPGNGVVKEIP